MIELTNEELSVTVSVLTDRFLRLLGRDMTIGRGWDEEGRPSAIVHTTSRQLGPVTRFVHRSSLPSPVVVVISESPGKAKV